MEVEEISPDELEIDPVNERNENVGPHKESDGVRNSLEESIKEQGIIQPPVARRSNGQFKVVVGQRRVLAAQSVGLETIPIIIMEWDDAEALEASITENVEAFRKSVSRTDRAAAIQRLMELNNWSVNEVAEELGIARATVDDWLERTRKEWEETVVHVDSSTETDGEQARARSEGTNPTTEDREIDIDKDELENISDTDLRTIRTGTDSPEERERVVSKVVQDDLTQREVREAKKRAERGEGSFAEVIDEVSQRNERNAGQIQVRTEVTFTGDYAEGLQRAAKDYGTSEEEVIRQAIGEYLTDEGYL